MGDLDTDPQMMRRQQAQDAAGKITPDETHEKRGPTDTDPASQAAREAAKAGAAQSGENPEDAVLRHNQGAAGAAKAPNQPAGTDVEFDRSLAKRDRSLLGS